MIIDKNTLKNEILDIKNGNVVEGLKIGIPEIDEFYRFKTGGDMSVFCGHANVGKTTFIMYLMTLFAKKHGLKFAVWSAENTPQSIMRKIIEFKMSKPIDTASQDEIEQSIDWGDKHFRIIKVDDLCTYKDVLEQIKGINDAYPIDGAFIDPYNALAKPKEEFKAYGGHELDYMIASSFRLWAKKNRLTLMISMHGVSEATRRVHPANHPMAGLTRPLTYSEVEGGVKWANRCDSFYSIHRYTQHQEIWNQIELHVLKVKEYETGGRPTSFDNPIRLKMMQNNVGYEYSGVNLMQEPKTQKQVIF